MLNPLDLQSQYLKLENYEKTFLELLFLQVQNNVSTVRQIILFTLL
jgi:hypothetical protein